MTEAVQNQAAPQEATQQESTQKPSTDLNISDLAALRNILDVASQRGAFKVNELESVGKVYNKLSMFLDAVSKAQEAQESQES